MAYAIHSGGNNHKELRFKQLVIEQVTETIVDYRGKIIDVVTAYRFEGGVKKETILESLYFEVDQNQEGLLQTIKTLEGMEELLDQLGWTLENKRIR